MRRLPLLAIMTAALLTIAGAHPRQPVSAESNCAVAPDYAMLGAEEQSALSAINDYRAQYGLGPLAYSAVLTRAARWKSNSMAAGAAFAHDDSFRSWSQRLSDCGYTAVSYASENIAAGNERGWDTAQQWFNSAGHRANILNPAASVIGIARAEGGAYGWYWTADFSAVGNTLAADPSDTN